MSLIKDYDHDLEYDMFGLPIPKDIPAMPPSKPPTEELTTNDENDNDI